jgi:hypothetical protein
MNAKALNVRCNSCRGQGTVQATFGASDISLEFGDEASLDLDLNIKSSGPVVDSTTLPLAVTGGTNGDDEGIHIDLVIHTVGAVDVSSGLRVVLPRNLKLEFDTTKQEYVEDKSHPLRIATGG